MKLSTLQVNKKFYLHVSHVAQKPNVFRLRHFSWSYQRMVGGQQGCKRPRSLVKQGDNAPGSVHLFVCLSGCALLAELFDITTTCGLPGLPRGVRWFEGATQRHLLSQWLEECVALFIYNFPSVNPIKTCCVS